MRLKQSIGVPPRHEHCSLDNFHPHNLSQIRALGEARRFVERYPGMSRGLMFVGTPGTGKTHLAVAILRELASRTQEDLLFVEFASILQVQRSATGAEVRKAFERKLRQVSVLVLDDFGLRSPSDANLRIIDQLIVARLQRSRLTILTGEPVSCRSLFRPCASGNPSRTQVFLSALHPALLVRFLSSVKILPVNGEDCRRFHGSLFP
jgi:DNA replication protein DnaC